MTTHEQIETLKAKLALKPPEVAVVTGIPKSTIYLLIQRGDLPAFQVGGKWYVGTRHLEQWMEAQAQARQAEQAELAAGAERMLDLASYTPATGRRRP
jgi:excisionase family DNA binding protein